MENALGRIGFRKEPRRFAAHLTIGRVRGEGPAVVELGRLLKNHADFNAGPFRVKQLVMFSSELTPNGPIYDALGRARLGGGA
jgi:2'-5' RNA ligase